MADTTKVNLAILTKTNEMIEELTVLTYRGKADVVDLAVARLYEEETKKLQPAAATADQK